MDNKYNPTVNKNYFSGELKSIKIDDRYHTWWTSGTLYITSNTNLPNYSYYLDVRSELGEFSNVPLYWTGNIQTKFNENNQIAYKVDAYKFSFSFNFFQSSHFNENLKYRNLEFQFSPMLNQNVIQDFEVEATTKDIQALITEINQEQYSKSFIYSNSFDLLPQINVLNLNALNLNSLQTLEVYVYVPPNDKPYFELINFQNLTSEFNLLKAEFRLSSGNSFVDFKLQPVLYRDKNVSLTIPLQIVLNKSNEFTVNDSDQLKGVFSQTSANISITSSIKFEYQKMIRTIQFNQNFSFSQNAIDGNLAKINFDRNIILNNYYQEIENEKIF